VYAHIITWLSFSQAGLPAPDALIYLTMSVEDAATRGGFGEERYETIDMQRRVNEMFSVLQDDTWSVVRANQEIDAVHSEVKGIAWDAIRKCQKSPLLTLWSGDPI
jgi:dTMP kinase